MYLQYIYNNREYKYIYIDDDGTFITPKQNYTNKFRIKLRGYGGNSYTYFSTDYENNVKRTRENFGKKRKPTGFI